MSEKQSAPTTGLEWAIVVLIVIVLLALPFWWNWSPYKLRNDLDALERRVAELERKR